MPWYIAAAIVAATGLTGYVLGCLAGFNKGYWHRVEEESRERRNKKGGDE